MKTITDIKKEEQNKVNELIENVGMFFAFSNEQFLKNKTPLKEGEKYLSIGGGGYLPKGNLKAFTDGMATIRAWKKAEVKAIKGMKEKEILYELHNHESFYTYDITDVVSLFKGTYTRKEIQRVFNNNISLVEA